MNMVNLIPELYSSAALLTALDTSLDSLWDRADGTLRARLDSIYTGGGFHTWGPSMARLADQLAIEAEAATFPHKPCRTPSECRREQICIDAWRCSAEAAENARATLHPVCAEGGRLA
jgi:hypothetical protein